NAAATDDGEYVVGRHRVELANRTVCSDAGAGERSRALGRERADGDQITFVRHAHQVGITARPLDAEVARRLRAQVIIAAFGHRARAAAKPWVDDYVGADDGTFDLSAQFDHLAADLMPHRDG